MKEELAPHVQDINRALGNKVSEQEIERELSSYLNVYRVSLDTAKRSIVKKHGGNPATLAMGVSKTLRELMPGEQSVNLLARIVSVNEKDVTVEVPGLGRITGDIAWGGNRFFLVEKHGEKLTLDNVGHLTDVSWRIRQALNSQGFADVDHVELFAPGTGGARSRNFVLCPGKAYDRSPCGTGTSAKLACLAADGKLAEGESWVQESIVGSRFEASYKWLDRATGIVAPRISGTAFITAESTLVLDERDPFCWGIR